MLLASRRCRSDRSASAWVWKFSVSVIRFMSGLFRGARPAWPLAQIVWSRPENMSGINKAKAGQFRPRRRTPVPRVAAMLRRTASLSCLLLAGLCAQAQTVPSTVLDPALIERVRQLAEAAARATAPPGTRVAVEIGTLDARLRLAPCQQVQPYLPPGMSAWGRTRLGLRCTDGTARWNVTLPVRVAVYGRALVANAPLPAGVNLSQEHLAMADIDIAAEPGAVFTDAAQVLGRTLARPLAASEALRAPALKSRQWFAAGETVQV
ncbi:MAG: flagellar basal body P-ring formation protein FlgA, partial [Rubrivivax sp.]